MTKVYVQLAISISIILLAAYSVITGNTSLLPIMQIVAGILAFVIGIDQIKRNKKALGFVLIGSSIVVWSFCILLYLM
ncbi:DUF3953 domain-containing protein [Bacillus manliponensis]|uniref:DUF3953 domain-containing protein n=1 Tax=Bacillus manliponensis TaxID=574376 RepID=UPI003511CE8B